MKKHLSSRPITTSTVLKASYISSQKTLLLVHINIGWNQSPTVPNHGDKVSDFKKKQQNPVCVYMTKTIGTTVLIYIDMMIFIVVTKTFFLLCHVKITLLWHPCYGANIQISAAK